MKIKNPIDRLSRAWGAVDKQHCSEILSHARGKRILDVGCGYGSLTDYARLEGFDSLGIDIEEENILEAKSKYPSSHYLCLDAENMDKLEGFFDTIIFRDSIHHLIYEANMEKVLSSMSKILSSHGRIIIFDPNLNIILRTARVLARHKDFSCSINQAKSIFLNAGYSLNSFNYYEVCGLMLTGGYVAPEIIGTNQKLIEYALKLNHLLSVFFRKKNIGRYFCWRYILVFNGK
jgi:SAM-dependent methyltransferase